MFTVEGYIDHVSYRVRFGSNPHAQLDPRTGRLGAVIGSRRALDLLARHEGMPVLVTPVGPTVTGSTTDPAGVLAVLLAHSEVTSVDGDAPQLLTPTEPGTVH